MLLATTLSTGCGADPRAASKENFQRAIDAKISSSSKLCLNSQPGNIFSETIVFPYRMLAGPLPSNGSGVPTVFNPIGIMSYNAAAHRELVALVDAGLASKRLTTVQAQHMYQYGVRPTTVGLKVEEYTRGPQFEKYSNEPVTANNLSSVGQLCFASTVVDHVDDYTAPGQMMGATMSEVHYHSKAVGIADWANAPAMRAAYPTIQEQLDALPSTQQTDTVVLMNDGWKAQ